MKTKAVKQLMVPVSEYATVSSDATLKAALKSLENRKMCYGDGPYRHCSLVVVNKEGHAVGRLSQGRSANARVYSETTSRLWALADSSLPS